MIETLPEPQPLPAWLLEIFPKRGDRSINHNHQAAEGPEGAVSEGRRNNTLTSLAGTMRRPGMSIEAIEAALLTENAGYNPPLPEDEVRGIARSVGRYPPADISQEGPEPEWGQLQDLPPKQPLVPTLGAEMVPEPLRAWIQDVAQRACAPLEMIACPVMVSLGALVGRKLGIRPSAFDDYLVVPNLWGGIIARPGFMKTHYVDQGTAHLKRLAAIAQEKFKAERWKWEAEEARIEAEIAAIKAKMLKAAKKGEDLAGLQLEFAELKRELKDAKVVEHRYLTQDATVEKLGELLKENPDGLLVLRDELAGWLRTLDKPGREGDREFYLEGWNGTGSYTFDRIGRGTVHIPAVCVSIFGGIQPGKLNSYIHEAITEKGGADGLLQRLQLTVWPDALGKWEKSERWPDTAAKNHAFEIFEYLERIDPVASGAHTEEGSIPWLRFTPEAQELFDDWRDELENRLRSDELVGTPAFESHLAKYRSLMPSLALLFHLVDCAAVRAFGTFGTADPATFLPDIAEERSPNVKAFGTGISSVFSGGVPLEAARLAAAWCEFLEQHARKVYADELYPGVQGAHNLAAKISQGVVTDGQSVRDVDHHHWSGLATSSQVNEALNTLAAIGWIRIETMSTGGRPTALIRLHPELR